MAISKAVAVGSVSGNYWVTSVVSQAPDYSQTRAQIRLFATQGAFLSGSPALFSQEFIMTGTDNPIQFHAVVQLVETQLVTLSGIVNGGSVV